MKWLRARTRQATSLALMALAFNLALAFGHIHLEDFGRAGVTSGVLLSAITHHQDQPNDGHDGHPDDFCPICMAQAALGTGLAAAAPVLPLDLAYATLDPVAGPELEIPQRPRAAFQSRGPPRS
jgi:hypothetical protein